MTKEALTRSFSDHISQIADKLSHPFPIWVLKAFLEYNSQDMITLYNTLMGKKENTVKAKSICRQYYKSSFKEMPKFLMQDHLNSFFEFLPHLIRGMGFKGWVLLIDEFEIMGKLGRVSRLKSYQNLSWLMNLNGEHRLPLYSVVASVKTLQTDVFYGGKKDDAKQMPLLAGERFGLEASAIVSNFFKQATSSANIILAPVQKADLLELMEQILDIHYQAVDWRYEVPDGFTEAALKVIDYRGKPLRQVLRLFIEIMDLYAISGKMPMGFSENLMQDFDFEEIEEAEGLFETPLDEMFDL